jgi:pilus assembly protein CpaE
MSNLEMTSKDDETRGLTQPWRSLNIVTDRSVLEQLEGVVRVAMPGAAMLILRNYPPLDELRRAFSTHQPNVIFLDIVTSCEPAIALIAEIKKMDPNANVIAMLAANDPQLILRCLRQGASEFLLQPFSAAQLESALNKLSRNLPKDLQPRKDLAKIYCVMPAKGACGASTLASNLAFHAKRSGKSRVLLADMDPLTGTLSFLLKIKSSYSFLDVVNRADGLDADLWKAMVNQRQGVDVLLAPESLFEGLNELRDATPVVEYARANYDVVVLDTPSVYGEWNLSQARLCDELILVTTNELPALQATQRALSYLEANKIGRWKLRVVVNRYDKDIGLSKDVIGTALHTEIFHVIPSDYEAVQRSLLEGKPVPATTSLGKSFTILGDRLSGAKKEPAKSGSSLSSLRSLFSRTSS